MNPTLRPDPYDPFSNPTQHRAYASHYRTILPQIGLPGYQVPLKPTKQERKRIRHYFNAAGFGLTAHFFLGADSCVGCHGSVAGHHGLCGKWRGCQYLYPAIFHLNGSERTFIFNGEYQRGCNRLPSDKNSHPQPVSYEYLSIFGDSSVSFYRDFIQSASGNVSTWITDLLGQGGITAYSPDIDYYGTGTAVVAEILYGSLIAPITEEFLYRGFVLKNLSRVSQRTGILLSAFLFGLGHQNISQFLLAFPLGVFFLGHLPFGIILFCLRFSCM